MPTTPTLGRPRSRRTGRAPCGCEHPPPPPPCGCEHPPPPPPCGCKKHPPHPRCDCGTGQSQSNSSRQSQVRIGTVSNQANVQNLSAGNFGDTYQGDANNANSGQASQQENRQASISFGHGCGCDGSADPSQSNSSRQKQVQIGTVSNQANVQNLSAGNFGDTSQGDANNANSGQASQQENRQEIGRASCRERV